ncbi:Por secretion system C-terminal sorting domain-containing protein [Aquimarina spongiae]|uniref:Por secretion system C-terminal sorting domain-containing protein n=2 Tax=Aquimarina spongiae TaxID=570521 RepID=A0A1M6JND4_9FLAO|nr:Por secretion system C-terminal sorting domain-containing protein [Aquimarina spongiae]
MKNVITVLFVLFSCIVFAQQTSIKITNYDYDARWGDGRCRDNIYLTAYFKGGGSQRFLTDGNGREGPLPDREFILDGIVERMDIYMYGKDRVNYGFFGTRCVGGSRGGRVRETFRRNIDMDPCTTGSFYARERDGNIFTGSMEVQLTLSFDYEITPLPDVQRTSPSDIVGYEDPFQVLASEEYNSSVYNWQYTFLDGTTLEPWQDFPGSSSSPVLDVALESLFDDSVIGKEILFRIEGCEYIGDGEQQTINYQIRKSAPHIIDISTKPVSCYDATDGEVTLTFDRPLIEGDLFGFSISDNSSSDAEIVANANNITTFQEGNTLTITNLPPSSTDFLIQALGTYEGATYFTGAPNHSATFVIDRPAPVAFIEAPADNVVNVFCFGGQDGSITINATGGIGGYEYLIKTENETWEENQWLPFSSATSHILENLFPDTYDIKIRDGNGCVAKRQTVIDGEIELGEEIVQQVVITQPDAPLFISTEVLNNPLAYNFTDGRIIATITGGTSFDNNSYEFEWRDQNNNIVTTTNTVYNEGQGYLVTLHSVGEGEYTLTARDANYAGATNKEGCTMTSESVILTQPPPIEISIQTTPISCNASNAYSNNIDTNFDGTPDQFQDGVLTATVTGGVPFDIDNPDYSEPVPTNPNGDLLPYFYHWRIQSNDGSSQEISTNNNYIDFLDTATYYSLNVTDKNGITLGTYSTLIEADGSLSYQIAQPNDVTSYLPQPEQLTVDFLKNDVTCSRGNDASLEALVTGGVPPYSYEWSNGGTTQNIDNLIAGTYIVFVVDANGCQVEGTITVEQPNTITIEPVAVESPTCAEGNDGQIDLNITGGQAPYTYLWNTGSTSNSLQNLSAGIYRIEITDATGCKAFYETTLENPEPLLIDMVERRSLCNDQSLELDVSIDDSNATYSWTSTNGFTSSESIVNLTHTGTYTATVTNGSGCVGVGQVNIETFDRPIDSNFYITTQAYTNEDVILINVSNPIGETVDWNVPEGVEIISQSNEELVVRFEQEGAYDINMRSYQGDCFLDFEKTILVQPAIDAPQVTNTNLRGFIEEFILYPNPSAGDFNAKISLKETSNIKIKIIDLVSGATMNERSESNNQEFLLDYSLSMSTGVYLMLLETPYGSETRKLIVQ